MGLDVLIVDEAEVPVRNVYEAGDGKEALAILENNDAGLVLSDINMPNMDGLEFLRNVKANGRWKDLPVVMITTEGSKAKVREIDGPGRDCELHSCRCRGGLLNDARAGGGGRRGRL